MNKPFGVTVVIPVFNGERYLAEAIESVLAQREPDLEIVVVDDGSTDGTAAVAAGFGDRIRLVSQANGGTAAARNHGIRVASADVLAFLDADDRLLPDALRLQRDRLERNPDVGVVVGQLRDYRASDRGETILAPPPNAAEEYLLMQFGCWMIRKSVFDTIGLLSEGLQIVEDWDWFTRAREAGIRLLIHRDVVLHRRLHDGNMTRQREAAAACVLEMLRRSLARRRAGDEVPQCLPPLSSFFESDEVAP